MSTRPNGFGCGGRFRSLAVFVMATAVAALLPGCGDRDVEVATAKAQSGATLLLRDIDTYRQTASTLEPQAAVKQWFALYDRAAALDEGESPVDGPEFDTTIFDVVGRRSLL